MSEHFKLSNPFPGLRPFEADEEHLFFGRDGQSDELLRRLRRSRFLAVLGTSGSGKSSLVRAGLLPALYGGIMTQAGSAWRVALFRPGHDPVGNLARALSDPEVFGDVDDDSDLQSTITEATLRRSALGLVEATRQARMPAHENLLVVVDQFEEIFRFKRTSKKEGSEDEAAAFVKLLLEARQQTNIPIFIVITMRSDFLGDCSQFRDLPEAINEGQYLIPRMTRDQRREAITGPIAVGGGEMASRLLNRLLNDVGDNPDQLPILQHSLMRTWDFWTQSRSNGEPIDLHHYEAVGTMSDALSRHADEAYNELPDEASRNIAEKLFKSLTEKGSDNREIRRPTRLKEICEVAEASERDVVAVIERFRQPGRSFLMPPTSVPLAVDSLIDISHESLIRGWERLRKWVDEEARSAQIYRRLAETAALHEEGSAGLWHDPDLALALRWREKNRPNAIWAQHYNPNFDQAMGFLAASKAAKEAEIAERQRQRRSKARRTRAFVAALTLAFLVSLGMALFANTARVRAESQTRIAEEQTKIAQAATREAMEQRSIAESQKGIAVEKAQEAETERKKAAEQAEIAEAAKVTAEKQAQIAREAQAASERARQQAAASEAVAINARKDLQSEFLETRRASLNSNSAIMALSSRLIELSAPKEAAVWRSYYSNALSMLGNHQKSADQASLSLEIEPDYLNVRAHRGYMYILTREPLKAVEDFNRVIEATPNSSLPYLNRAVVNGLLGRFDAAHTDIDAAIKLFRAGEYDSLSESELSEEIQAVIGRNFLSVDQDDYYVALLYERASLQAAAGDPDFVQSLNQARQQQRLIGSTSKGASLTALNWAWLHRRERSGDYGILANEGALWEQVGRPDLARRDYDLVLEQHNKLGDPRYQQIARWAKEQSSRLPLSVPEKATAVSSSALAVEADQLYFNEDYQGALQRLDQAIGAAPKHKLPSLFLKRSDVRFNLKDYAGSEEDAAAALQSTKSPLAYYYHARAMNWRDYQGTNTQVMAELGEALKLDPTYAPALRYLASLSSDADALNLYKRLAKVWPNASWVYKEIAVLENRLGQKDQAYRSIGTAIEIYSEAVDFFDVRAQIETNLGKSINEVQSNQIGGYRKAIASLSKHNKLAAAQAYLKLGQLQEKLKLPEDSLQSINKAIELDNGATEFHDFRAKVELDLGQPENGVISRQANGYVQAIEALLDRGKVKQAAETELSLISLIDKAPKPALASFRGLSDNVKRRLAMGHVDRAESLAQLNNLPEAYRAYKEAARTFSYLAGKGDTAAAGDLQATKAKMAVLRELAKTRTTVELVSARIVSTQPAQGATRQVTIDRGSEDGLTLEGTAAAWSSYSKEKEHERKVQKLGKAKILELGKRSAIVEVTMDNPIGDGQVIEGDLIEVRANVPALMERSVLWQLAKYHINYLNEDGKPIVGDYRELYLNEDEQLVEKVYAAMIADIKTIAVRLANHELMGTKITEGRFKDKTLREVLQNPTRADIIDYLNYVMKYPATNYGQDIRFGRSWSGWVLGGTPQ
ncbi:MAG TPA: hypothetical protein VJU86_05630 [Pyrinomonadaceae bacterium]|nr:hypothetical protein [Pyrinomonadaceae bacterium]